MENLLQEYNINHWLIKFVLIIFIIIFINISTRVILSTLKKQFSKTNNIWDDCIIDSIYKPFTILIWILGIVFTLEAFNSDFKIFNISNDFLINLKRAGIILSIALFLNNLSRNFQFAIIKNNKTKNIDVDEATYEAITKIIRLSIIVTSGLIILQTFGFSISGVLAFGGIGGVAVGFAAKDMLANFFGGLMIYLDRPFRKGDWIRSPDRELEGTVENIGWRQTSIRNFRKNVIYIPNSVFMNIIVENPSRMTHRRIREVIGLRYKDLPKMLSIVEDVKIMISNHSDIDHNQTTIVNFDSYNDSSIDFFIITYADTTEWARYHEIKQDVLMKIGEIIEKNNAEIAFPTRVEIQE
ncbi:MAG: mechanosensitive ion channel family protein [Gammaproteobacteria bacterium]|jgi:MscS family membrane protein|nr:mechanosensitive ion channel family protein [Gammaproteobacteria bacterium]